MLQLWLNYKVSSWNTLLDVYLAWTNLSTSYVDIMLWSFRVGPAVIMFGCPMLRLIYGQLYCDTMVGYWSLFLQMGRFYAELMLEWLKAPLATDLWMLKPLQPLCWCLAWDPYRLSNVYDNDESARFVELAVVPLMYLLIWPSGALWYMAKRSILLLLWC